MTSKFILIFIITIFSANVFSQSIIDTIITNNLDTIACQVTYVNNYSIFYKYRKKNKIKDSIIQRINVSKLTVNNKNVTMLEEKKDNGINDYFKKSKLLKTYETLLLTNNTDSVLKILADSTFTFKKVDYFLIASKIQNFANQYRCKLIFASNIQHNNTYSVNIKLYDATDKYYKKVLNSYKKEKIYFLRTDNNFEQKEYTFKLNNNKITLKKNDYYTCNYNVNDSSLVIKQDNLGFNNMKINDSTKINKYFFVGDASQYGKIAKKDIAVFGAAILTGAIGGLIIVGTSSNYYSISNFIGEFMKTNIDNFEYNNAQPIKSNTN